MKILFLRQYNPYAESSASANRFRGLIDGLRHVGHHVDVAVCGGRLKNDLNHANNNGVIYLSKANYYSYWMTRFNTYVFKSFIELVVKYRFSKLRLNSYDIIWLTNDSEIALELFLKEEDIKAKTFMELNEFDDFYVGKNYSFLQLRRVRNTDRLFQKAIKKIDGFGVMTNTLINYYKPKAGKHAKFMHLPMTVDMSRFLDCDEDILKLDQPYIAFCGSMDKSKDGVDVLIKSFIKIAEKYPAIKLYLAGFKTYDTPELLKIVEDNHMDDRIKYIGPLDRTQIPSFICNASVLALSRPDSHQAQGGFPTKLGEYLSTGHPVCVTSVGEIPIYLSNNESAFMAEPGSIDSFADALDRAFSNPRKAELVGQRGRFVAEQNFSSFVQSNRLAIFLEELK